MGRPLGPASIAAAGSTPVVSFGCRGEVKNIGHSASHCDRRHLCTGDSYTPSSLFSAMDSPYFERVGRGHTSTPPKRAFGGSNPSALISPAEALCWAAYSATSTVRPPSAKALGNILRKRAAGVRLSRDTLPDRYQGQCYCARGDRGLTPRLYAHPSEESGGLSNRGRQRGPYSGPEVSHWNRHTFHVRGTPSRR